MTHFYKLVDRVAVPCTLLEWAGYYEGADRVVAQTNVPPHYHVSTVFLGIDHQWRAGGPPLIFETMIFGDYDAGEYQDRCSTWEQAEAMHARAVYMLTERNAKGIPK